jgi:hypothetical protein
VTARSGQVDTVECDASAGRGVQTYDESRNGGLSTTGLAHQRQRLATPDIKRQAVDGLQVPPRLALEDAVEPWFRHVEVATDILQHEQRAL